MARTGYMTVETTNIRTIDTCFSFQYTEDIENGTIVGKGELVDGEDSIYLATSDFDEDNMYLVANPAWIYDVYTTADLAEEKYINKANKAFRVYKLKKDDIFKIGNVDTDTAFEVGQYLTYANGKWTAGSDATNFKVTGVEQVGYAFPITTTTVGTVGYKYTVEVVEKTA